MHSQINGDAMLNFDPARGEVKAPLVLWGPYLWAQGNTPRKVDGLTWTQNDVRADQLHPSEAGCRKTTALLLNFFKTNEGTCRWFLKPGKQALAAPRPNSLPTRPSRPEAPLITALAALHPPDTNSLTNRR